MNIPLSTIENTFTHVRYGIPKVAKNVLYICLQTNCNYKIVSRIQLSDSRSFWTDVIKCPECGSPLWKVIK